VNLVILSAGNMPVSTPFHWLFMSLLVYAKKKAGAVFWEKLNFQFSSGAKLENSLDLSIVNPGFHI
jgi:hypothetical protein